MGTLRELPLKQAYHKPEDDIAHAFYLPCLAAAQIYDRAVGYFSSAIYVLAWPSLREFVASGGKIRLICSRCSRLTMRPRWPRATRRAMMNFSDPGCRRKSTDSLPLRARSSPLRSLHRSLRWALWRFASPGWGM